MHGSAQATRTAAAVVVLVALAALGWSALSTTSARVSATTENAGNVFRSGTIDVSTSAPQPYLFDATGLYPGEVVQTCVEVAYTGSVGADVRLYGAVTGGSGLERFAILRLELGANSGPDCEGFDADSVLWDGTLAQLVADHPNYPSALVLIPESVSGDTVWLRASATIADDDDAQGRDTEFWLVLEARP
ncbi:MAG: hypothetical protein KDB21_14820 [Acidimicrobiales bacterium]|nr:hypothetical protein [Acidimicrobiales bacterium]